MASEAKEKAAAARKPFPYEFCGPFGTLFLSLFLPVLVLAFSFTCNEITGCPAPSLLSPKTLRLEQLKREVGWPKNGIYGLVNLEVTGWVLGYYLINAVLYRILPATYVEGVELSSGGRLKYRFNSFYSNMLILSVCAAGTVTQGADFPLWTFISDNHIQIATANILISAFIATFVYVRSFSVKPGNKEKRELAKGGCSGNMVYDWWMGRELNPRVTIPLIGEMDLKQWLELRPGLLGWILMNCAWTARQYRNYGYVTDSIIFVSAVQSAYIIDSWYNEAAILTTMDIISDGFGFMLSFGDLAWVPFIYSTQARYLSVYPITLGPLGLAAMFGIVGLAFYIFRAANNQKNAFRANPNDPAVAHIKYIETKRGTKLMISGWWGVARHINYLGDWLQSWPYCLPTGLAGYTILSAGTIVNTDSETVFTMADGRQVIQGDARGFAVVYTYFYAAYFAFLLVHRDLRDDDNCARKYGDDWARYKKIVRWRIIPGIY
jgi:delta14-sterol reductase